MRPRAMRGVGRWWWCRRCRGSPIGCSAWPTEAGAGDAEGARHTLQGLRARHMTVADVVTDPALRAVALADIDREFDELERIAEALSVLREVSPRWLDTIAAAGEMVSSRMVAAALASHGLDGVVGRRAAGNRDRRRASGGGARLPRDHRGIGDAGRPAPGRRPACRSSAGFVGATAAGITTTLGRGGSDYSAADRRRLPRCARDPDLDRRRRHAHRRSPARRVAARSCRTCRSPKRPSWPISAPRCCTRRRFSRPSPADIPVRILNSKRAEAPGTLITADRPASDRPLTALASKKHVTVVDITSTRMLMAHGFLRRLFEAFERHKTPVDVVTTSEVSVSVTVDDTPPSAGDRRGAVGVRRGEAASRRWPSSARWARGCSRNRRWSAACSRPSATCRFGCSPRRHLAVTSPS